MKVTIKAEDLLWYAKDDCLGQWLCMYGDKHFELLKQLRFESHLLHKHQIKSIQTLLDERKVPYTKNLRLNVNNDLDTALLLTQIHVDVTLFDPSYEVTIKYLGMSQMISSFVNNTKPYTKLDDKLIAVFSYNTMECLGLLKYILEKIDHQKRIEFITFIDSSNKIHSIYNNTKDCGVMLANASSWYEELTTYGHEWDINQPHPPKICMMPNMSIQYNDEYQLIREQCAWRWKELSLLYYIGLNTRKMLHQSQVYTLSHPQLFELIPAGKNVDTQKIMLSKMFEPIVKVQLNFRDDLSCSKFVYFDVETTMQENKTVVNVVGLVYQSRDNFQWKYMEWHSTDDNYCIHEAAVWMAANVPDHTVVHYTAADLIAIPESMKKLDLHQTVTSQYTSSQLLQALNLNNFKLKTIYKNICARVGMKHLYDRCYIKNGLQAMKALEVWIETPDICDTWLEDVIEYNRVDCLALLMLHQYILDTWDWPRFLY